MKIYSFLISESFSTEDSLKYDSDLFKELGNGKAVVFEFRGQDSANIGFFSGKNDCSPIYEDCSNMLYWFWLGGHGNYDSGINRKMEFNCCNTSWATHYKQLQRVNTPEILSDMEFRSFWTDFDNGLVRVGKGDIVGSNIFLEHQTDILAPKYIGFMTGWGTVGSWTIKTTITTPGSMLIYFLSFAQVSLISKD